MEQLATELASFVPGRVLHVPVMLRIKGAARSILWASQVVSGTVNG